MPTARKKAPRSSVPAATRDSRPNDPWLSIRQAATALAIAPQTVYARIAEGALESMRAAGRTFVHRESVARLKAQQAA